MSPEKTQEVTLSQVLDLVEGMLRAQLNTVRSWRRKMGLESEGPRRRRGRSQMDMVYDVLSSAGRPLHITEILRLIHKRFGLQLNRESVVSALIKRVHSRDRFVKVGPNTFALIEWDSQRAEP